MISISAFHYTHRMVVSHAQPLAGETGAAQSESPEPWHLSQNRQWQTNQPRFRESLRTALSYKQTALEHLKHEVWEDPERNSDAVVAAIVLFICMDVVEYGSHGWNHHLRGAEEMVRSRKLQRNEAQDGSAPWLKYFDTACTTFGILGATLAPASSHSSLRLPLLDPAFLQTLRHSENQTWVGCPAELLYFLSTINSLRSLSATAPERIQVIPELCHRLLDFCPATWAEDFPNHQHHESRSHLAHAYKAAVEIYTSHIIGASPGQHYLSQPFIDAAIRPAILHMLAIWPQDFHIKSLVWPAFVIGAQSDSQELRQMIRDVFQRIWVSSCCYNSKNAVGILEAIWAQSSHEPWLEFVWQLEENWLFV
ncbi:Acriflavine sensitivity control protein acr-2 [Colletotrichum trifolii]|uniref:Acriflavine sensitivity control protein acr-2 n=1 Tax=Colletotrichum trifolii TaxID=5466 RepID=A0A4R8RU99_COLTR|nr:Acriflavine sensitivity control protein acr-2 [Colletotrichum trifolii]